MHFLSLFFILFSNFSISMLKVFKLEDGGLDISPIIVLQLVLNIVLSISINVDSYIFFVSDWSSLFLYCILLCI